MRKGSIFLATVLSAMMLCAETPMTTFATTSAKTESKMIQTMNQDDDDDYDLDDDNYYETFTGKCGENLTWTLDTKTYTLTISGTGAMSNNSWSDEGYAIKNLVLNNGITSICEEAFEDAMIKSVAIPDSVTSIGDRAFSWCEELTNVKFGKNIKKIGYMAFYGCNLKSITIPDSIKSIDKYAFCGNKALNEVILGKNVESIGEGAFNNTNIKKIVFSKKLKSIGADAFLGTQLSSITIPDSVTSIGDFAFAYNKKLTSISIGKNLKTIGKAAFDECLSLSTIKVNTNNPYFSVKDNVLFNKKRTKLVLYPAKKSASSYTIPTSVDTIGCKAFHKNQCLTKVTIGKKVKSIEDDAFACCKKLSAVNLGEAPAVLGKGAFGGNKALTSFSVSSKNKKLAVEKGVLYNKAKTQLIQYPLGSKATSYTIGSKVTTIAYEAFKYSPKLKEVTMPNTVKKIGQSAFGECDNLKKVTLSKNVETIDRWAFSSTKNLKSLTIGKKLNKLESGVFYGEGTKTLYFEGNMPKSMSLYIFSSNHTPTIYVPKGNKTWNSAKKQTYGAKKINWKTWK